MAFRIVFPGTFTGEQKLLTDVNTKHVADGANSDLKPYFTQQGINLTTDIALGVQAAAFETTRGLYSRSAENLTQLRDNAFHIAYSPLSGMLQFLKSFYKGNDRELGNWGVTMDGKARIVYPTDFDGQVALFKAVMQKHATLAAASPLTLYLTKQGLSVTALNTALGSAVNHNTAMGVAKKNAEDARKDRDNVWTPVVARLKGSLDFLKKLNSDNPKALGAYGVVVDDSPRAPKLRTTTLKAGEQITNNAVSIGGTFTNTSTGDLHVYKGKTTTGTPTIVHAGEQLGIMKGWSVITVVNPSSLNAAKFSVPVTSS